MDFIISLINTLLPLLYFISTYLYGKYLFLEDKFAERFMSTILFITVGVHFVEVALRTWHYHHFPLASVFEAMSVLAFAAVLIYLYLESQLKVKTTGYFVLVFVFFLQFFSSAFINFTSDIPEILHSSLFVFHTGAAILGYTGFAISFLYGLMYLLLFYDIKRSRFGIIFSRLPSLEILANLTYSAAIIGFIFLTIAIILGSIWSQQLFGKFFNTDPKILIAYLTWIIYGVDVVGWKFLRWSGKRLAKLSILGFGVILFSIITVNFFITSFHEFR